MIHAFSVLEFSENYCWRWRCRLGNYWSRVLDDGFETDYELIEVLTPEHNFCFAYVYMVVNDDIKLIKVSKSVFFTHKSTIDALEGQKKKKSGCDIRWN